MSDSVLRLALREFLHGGDYSPEQWQKEDWERDIALLKKTRGNLLTVGVFAWVRMEPREGEFDFTWLDDFMDLAEREGVKISFSTPSASPPLWMGSKYPEILRVAEDGGRYAPGMRTNVCYTSPVYRKKVAIINGQIARRYGLRRNVIWWHISNEYCQYCYCDLCQAAFREWLRPRYGSLETLNRRWNTAFWGHTYMAWEEIIAPGGKRECSCEALWIDWKRFYTDQVVDFMCHEIAVLRTTDGGRLPMTTNFMSGHEPFDYWRFARAVDFISLDSYPLYHDRPDNWVTAANQSFHFDMMRTFKGGQSWILMESSPSSANWMPVMRLKRPGMHLLECAQAVAHGSDAVLYFQVKKSLGGREKFHGAVIDHAGDNSRVFQEVAETGAWLEGIQPMLGADMRAEVAVIFDWENRWAIDANSGPRAKGRDYMETCQAHYRALWQQGIPVDVIESDSDFSPYRLVIAPMLYMVKPNVAARLETFAHSGGCVVGTYWTGIANETDSVVTSGFPGPLRALFGIRSEELDVLYDDESNHLIMNPDNRLGIGGSFRLQTFCDLIHLETAEALGCYGEDFYCGRPGLTRNEFANGEAYYIAARAGDDFHLSFYRALALRLGLGQTVKALLPTGVTAQMRSREGVDFVFLLNFTAQPQTVEIYEPEGKDILTTDPLGERVLLPPFGIRIFSRASETGSSANRRRVRLQTSG